MPKKIDPAYRDNLYGTDGYAAACVECGAPADYLEPADGRPKAETDWSLATPWCVECRIRPACRPAHSERYVRHQISTAICSECPAPAHTLLTGPRDPSLSQLRRSALPVAYLVKVLARATPFCVDHEPRMMRGAAERGSKCVRNDRDAVRRALVLAGSDSEALRMLGYSKGGLAARELAKARDRYAADDPAFPALPSARRAAQHAAAGCVRKSGACCAWVPVNPNGSVDQVDVAAAMADREALVVP